jgi:hypothetical protein
MPPKNKNAKKSDSKDSRYRLGAPRGDQKFEVANKIKPKRGGGDEWRQWSRTTLAQSQTAASANDFYEKAFVPGEK